MKMMGSSGRASRTRRCKFKSIHSRHTDVCNQTACYCEMASSKEILPERKHPRGEAGGFDEAFQRFANSGIIINDSDDGFCLKHPSGKSPYLHISIVGVTLPARYYVFISSGYYVFI